ncbi:MAG: regulatory protein GntR [Paenibacillus sp.]|nr:regulatory protein GntR [Paenibacillus sp.]
MDVLRGEIRNGTYTAGEYLPSEVAQATRFGLSNKSVRKGLDLLVEEGLIEKIPKVGSRVKPRSDVTLTLAFNGTNLRDLEQNGLLADFRQRFPWIQFQTRMYGSVPELLRLMESEPIDLVTMNNLYFETLANSDHTGMLEPLDAPPDAYPFLVRQFSSGGRLLVQPLVFSPIVLCYNKAHFRECGLPEPDGSWTWDDLMDTAAILTNTSGRYGFSFHLPDWNRWPIFLLQSGERFEWEGTKLKEIRGTKLMDSIRLCKKLIHNRTISPLYVSESNGEIARMFQAGKISMMLTSYLGMNVLKFSDVEYDISPIPFIHEPRTLGITIGIGMNKHSQHKQEALLFVHYLMSARGRGYILDKTLSIPAFRQLSVSAVKPGLNSPERFAIYREMLFSIRTQQDLNLPQAAFPVLSELLKTYWADMISEDELCNRMTVELSEVAAKNRGAQEGLDE